MNDVKLLGTNLAEAILWIDDKKCKTEREGFEGAKNEEIE
jgi:hypothetical protein